jgi:hypothetical protein
MGILNVERETVYRRDTEIDDLRSPGLVSPLIVLVDTLSPLLNKLRGFAVFLLITDISLPASRSAYSGNSFSFALWMIGTIGSKRCFPAELVMTEPENVAGVDGLSPVLLG